MSSKNRTGEKILYCHCAFAKAVPEEVKDEVLRKLQDSGVEFEGVADLCALSAGKDPKLGELTDSGPLKIAACYPRAVRWLFHAAGAPLDEDRTEILNMREQTADEVVAGLLKGRPEAAAGEGRTAQAAPEWAGDGLPPPNGWKPWFPVIDYERCTNCMQCLSFCLFDVYGVDAEQNIQVQNQNKCKTDCPACSRVCPEAAILFPKYHKSPINGAPVNEENLNREAMKTDISALLGGDLYGALRRRTDEARKRFSSERDESRALLERKRCLKKLGEKLDIPSEILMTLPSVEDIEERFARAREKAERRRERSQSVQDEKAAPSSPSEEEWGI